MAWMVLMAIALPTTAQVSLVSTGSVWSYLDNGSDQGTAWRAPGFDDSTWKNGFAPLGYGDAWIVTTNDFGPDANNKYVTTYYREIFNVANASAITNLLLRIRRDDGPVVYLNGTEVFRTNMPSGTIGYRTLAPAAVGGADESTWYSTAVSATRLVREPTCSPWTSINRPPPARTSPSICSGAAPPSRNIARDLIIA